MKLRGLSSPTIGILIRKFKIGPSINVISLSVKPFAVEYPEPKKFGRLSSVNPFFSSQGCSSSNLNIQPVPR